MSTVKFIKEITSIYFFQLVPFELKVDQRYPIFHWSWKFWEILSVISFLKNFSRMKLWWWEDLQLPVATKSSFLSSYER